MNTPWIVCQLGAREHYAVARALHRQSLLDRLYTDTWVPPSHPLGLGRLKSRMQERFHPELAAANVSATTLASATFELKVRMRKIDGWDRIIRRNDWFQKSAVHALHQVSGTKPKTLFAYSYAALNILRFARERGWSTVLGQIDPGPAEERIVARLHANQSKPHDWSPAPKIYWDLWRRECELADRIMVNSLWSKNALVEEGLAAAKIGIVPLAYEPPTGADDVTRVYPARFDAARPLRVLFLGQINLRKGLLPLLDAITLLRGEPVEFWFAGPIQFAIPDAVRHTANVRWFGSIPRSETSKYYRDADLFIFPTYSDGFGLTQLEAQAWKLPIVASRRCGDVVSDGSNGLILQDITADAIANAIRACAANPELLRNMAERSLPRERFSLKNLGENLVASMREPLDDRILKVVV